MILCFTWIFIFNLHSQSISTYYYYMYAYNVSQSVLRIEEGMRNQAARMKLYTINLSP